MSSVLSMSLAMIIDILPTTPVEGASFLTYSSPMKPVFTIATARTDELSEVERTAIVELCTAAHATEFGPLFSFLPSDGLHVIGMVDERIVGHAVVTTRWLQPATLPLLKTAYVDAVATHPDYQGQGIGSAVMRHLASVITEYDIACLETERVGFYAQLGWEEWRGPLAGRRGDDLIPTPGQTGIMILRLSRTPPLDLDNLLTIKEQGRIW